MGQIIVQAIVTVMTGGTGTAATQATMEAAVKMAVNAAIKNLVRQALTQLITAAITGNSLKLDLDSMIKGAVKAGVVSYADSLIDLKVVDHDTSNLAQNIQSTVLTTGVETAVYGGSYIDNLKNNVINNETMKATEKMFSYIGHKSSIKDNLPAKTVVHALVGGVASKLKGGDFSAGAIATATGHVVGEYVRDLLLKNPYISEKELEQRVIAVSRVVGGAAALTTSKNISDKDLAIAQDMSENVVKNNLLFLIPIVYAALEVTDKAIDAYDMYQLARAVEAGDDDKVKEISTTIAIGLATEGIPGNKILQKVSNVFKSSKLGKGIEYIKKISYRKKSTKLISELVENGVKVSEEKVVGIIKVNDKIIFLETGNINAGLKHIIDRHGKDFAKLNVKKDEISSFIMNTVKNKKPIGKYGKGGDVYKVIANKKEKFMVIVKGNNGYIVTAHPLKEKELSRVTWR